MSCMMLDHLERVGIRKGENTELWAATVVLARRLGSSSNFGQPQPLAPVLSATIRRICNLWTE